MLSQVYNALPNLSARQLDSILIANSGTEMARIRTLALGLAAALTATPIADAGSCD